jgi:hypothetical protein
VLSKSDLKGEDAVFQRIYDDKETARCFWNPKACEIAKSTPKRRQFIAPKP